MRHTGRQCREKEETRQKIQLEVGPAFGRSNRCSSTRWQVWGWWQQQLPLPSTQFPSTATAATSSSRSRQGLGTHDIQRQPPETPLAHPHLSRPQPLKTIPPPPTLAHVQHFAVQKETCQVSPGVARGRERKLAEQL